MSAAAEEMLQRVLAYVADQGIAGKSLRDIAAGVGTSHRMLLYHFGSREGLMTAIVKAMEERQRALMRQLARQSGTSSADAKMASADAMMALWDALAGPQVRPFVRLFFEVFGLAAQGTPGTEAMLEGLTTAWLDDAAAVAAEIESTVDARTARLGVAVIRGLLIDLLAGTDPGEVRAAYRAFVDLVGGR